MTGHFRAGVLLVLAAAVLAAGCAPTPPSRPAAEPGPTAPAPSPIPSTGATTTRTLAPGGAGRDATDVLQRRHQLAQVLPHQSAHYRIDFAVAADGRLAVRVMLLAVLNHSRDLATYEADLRRYRAEALAFIRAQGDDPSTYTVTFLPDLPPPSPKEGP